MLNDWLSYTEKTPSPYGVFRIIDVVEKKSADNTVFQYLGEQILSAYRNLDELKLRYEKSDEATLREYLSNYVFPADTYTLVKNVRQGDFGEVLASLIVEYFQGLVIPIHKMRYKFNKDRSVFCTDMMSHNAGDKITDLYYYEIKSRLNITKENAGGIRHYITIIAHNSLLKDEQTPNEAIADFLTQRHYEQGEFELANKYNDIVLNSSKYNRNFELFFIIEKGVFNDSILTELESLPPTLKPLCVTIVLIEDLNTLVVETYKHAMVFATTHVLSPVK